MNVQKMQVNGTGLEGQSNGARVIDLGTGASAADAGKIEWKSRLAQAMKTLQEYKTGKAALEARVIADEKYMRLHNWESKAQKKPKTSTETNSAWLFNCILNKHADAMDNYPEPNVLPREATDERAAKALTEVLPCVLEVCRYEKTYDRTWWDKLVKGTGVKAITWDTDAENGMGEVSIKRVDVLNVYWDTACEDIQDSRNFFCVALVNNDLLKEQYPELQDKKLSAPTFEQAKYAYETTSTDADKSAVIDWYYKRRGVLHYVKFVGDTVLYASEDDERYSERGYYDHGKYPFVFDPMFTAEGSPAGFSYVDLMRDAQDYIDRLDSAVIRSALVNANPKYFIMGSSGMDEKELLDPEKPLVHVNGVGDVRNYLMPQTKSELNGLYVQILNNKINELKETSGNRDVQQGGTTAGVTAYSAIAAMMEAGSKPSRDMIRASWRAFTEENYLCIELFRQFYTAPRYFRVTGDNGGNEYVEFDNTAIAPQPIMDVTGESFGERMPIFDIKIKASKQTAYSRMSQNELAKELYGAGLFAPEMADQAGIVLDMMQFEGVEQIREKVRNNGGMYQQMMQMQMQMQQMAQIIDGMTGAGLSAQVAQQGAETTGNPKGTAGGQQSNMDSLGNETQSGSRITKPIERAASATEV